MNIEARKISLLKEVLNIDNEKIIRAVEELLHRKETEAYEENLKPMSMARYKSEFKKQWGMKKMGDLLKPKI